MFNFWKSLLSFFLLHAVDPDNVGPDAGDDEATPELEAGDSDRMAQLEANLNGVIDVVKGLANGHTTLQQSIQQLSEALTTANTPRTPDPEPLDENDLETMSRKDLLAHIQATMDKRIKENLTPVTDRIREVDDRLDGAITSVTVKEFKTDHPDLMEWKAEIAEIFKTGRASNIPDAYALARGDNPEKVKSVDQKYRPATKTADVVSLGFKGFPGQGTKNTRMTTQQAAEAAWEEATAAMPGIDQFLNSDMR